jgi:hypothetical protein
MGTKNKTQDTSAGTSTSAPPRKTRTPVSLAPNLQMEVDAAKAKIKEAKALNKIATAIGTLSPWSLDQIGAVIERRREALEVVNSKDPQ